MAEDECLSFEAINFGSEPLQNASSSNQHVNIVDDEEVSPPGSPKSDDLPTVPSISDGSQIVTPKNTPVGSYTSVGLAGFVVEGQGVAKERKPRHRPRGKTNDFSSDVVCAAVVFPSVIEQFEAVISYVEDVCTKAGVKYRVFVLDSRLYFRFLDLAEPEAFAQRVCDAVNGGMKIDTTFPAEPAVVPSAASEIVANPQARMVALLHLPESTTDISIRNLLSIRGLSEAVEIYLRYNTRGEFLGLAKLVFATHADSRQVVASLNGVTIDGVKIEAAFSRHEETPVKKVSQGHVRNNSLEGSTWSGRSRPIATAHPPPSSGLSQSLPRGPHMHSASPYHLQSPQVPSASLPRAIHGSRSSPHVLQPDARSNVEPRADHRNLGEARKQMVPRGPDGGSGFQRPRKSYPPSEPADIIVLPRLPKPYH